MQIFEKRSFWAMLGLSIVTFGLYYVYYYVRTNGQLKRAGNQVASLWLLFAPSLIYGFLDGYVRLQGLINEFDVIYFMMLCLRLATYISAYYFWFNYVKAYCRTIKYNSESTYVWKYFLTFLGASWALVPVCYLGTYTPVTLYLASHPMVAVLILFLFALYGNIATYFLFQKGFNEYVAQDQTLEK